MGTQSDFEQLGPIAQHPNTRLVNVGGNAQLMQKFKQGHQGTTSIFAMVIQKMFDAHSLQGGNQYDRFIHIDGDMYFKRESISILEAAFAHGYDIVGTRRCYGNNPSGVQGLEQWPDTVSTFIFGMKLAKIPHYDFDKMCRYCEGAEHPLGWLVLDAFDGVTHATMQNGGTIHYLDQNQFGSQCVNGKKHNNYPSNMHMDVGSHTIHWGGVGSGYAHYHGHSKPEAGYANWACGRWKLFAQVFYQKTVEYNEPTQYTPDGRWKCGQHDEKIYWGIINDMMN